MNYLFKPLWLVLLVSSFLFACSESAENDPGSKDGPNAGEVRPVDSLVLSKDGKFVLDGETLSGDIFSPPGELTGFGSAEQAKLQAENLHKPIIYGVGGGGVTINNTFEESKSLLTPPDFGPLEDGRTWYNEQLMVQWKLDGSRKPRFVAFLPGYKGTLDAGSFGKIGMETKWLKYKGGNPEEGARKLIVELHRELEQVPDPNYNCMEQTKYKRCILDWGGEKQTNFAMIFPGIQILVAKAEFQIGIMVVPRNSEPGLLANRYDILTGDILVPEQAPVKLGQTKKEIFDRLIAEQGKTDPEVFVGTSGFGYLWEGIYLEFFRTNYVNTLKEAEDDNPSNIVQVISTFPDFLTLGGLRILMSQTSDDLSFELETEVDPVTGVLEQVPVSEKEIIYKLKMTTPIYKQNSKLFSDKFAKFIADELGKTYEVVEHRSFGHQDAQKISKRISTTIRAYNKSDYNGIGIAFSVDERQGALSSLAAFHIDSKYSPFNVLTYGASDRDVVLMEGTQILRNEQTGEPIPDLETAKPAVDPATCQWYQVPETGQYITINPEGTAAVPFENCKTLPNLLTCEPKKDPSTGKVILNEKGEPVLNMETCEPLKDFSTALPKTFFGKLPHFSHLAGMKLNDLVRLTEVDALGRGEASVEYMSGSKMDPERSGYTEQGGFDVPDRNLLKERQQSFVNVGQSGTVLGLKNIATTPEGTYGRVVSISTNNLFASIYDLCGLEKDINLKIGMTEKQVEEAIVAAVDSRRASNPKFSCNYFKVQDNGNLGYLSDIYFPDQRIKLGFSERALTSVTIYLPMTKVNTQLAPEVK